MSLRVPTIFALLNAALIVGCGAKVAVDPSPSGGGAGGSGGTGGVPTTTSTTTTSTTTTTTTSTTSTGTGGGPVDAGPDASPPPPPAVYAHSGAALFLIDPAAQTFKVVGNFAGCNSVVDLAVDHTGRVFATAPDALYRVDPANAVCTLVASGSSYPNSLSFVPAGTLDPDKDALVGYRDATYLRIDEESGAITEIGSLQGGFVSSGDLVAHPDGTAFLSAKGPGCNNSDCYLQIDPKSGGLVAVLGKIGATDVWGLAFWGGTRYAFTKSGGALVLDASGHGSPLTLSGLSSGFTFWGAGSSTAAAQ
ncbi:MAG: hypothetical protein QM820_03375 [Minicystis sp.]